MRVTILGASGFVGHHLAAALRARGDEVVTASLRDPAAAATTSAGSDAVVNLAGAPVSQRWTKAHRREIARTRIDLPRAYLAALANVAPRPRAYVSASAVGYYGTSRSATFTETSPAAGDFLARVCADWEATADGAAALGLRVAKIRTGLALGTDGGALAKLLPLFRAGLGGVIGDGAQWCWPAESRRTSRSRRRARPNRSAAPSGARRSFRSRRSPSGCCSAKLR